MSVPWGQVALHGSTAGVIGALAWGTFVPQSGMWGALVWRGRINGPPSVALTFDDGPHPVSTPRVLDELAATNTKAAFFLIGSLAARHPQLVRRIHADGHLVGNHTYDHPALGLFRGPVYWNRQVDRTDQTIADLTGVRPALFRPPVGIKTLFSARAARHHTVVTWSRRAFDGVVTTPQRIVERLGRSVAGDILLLHDGVSPQSRRDPDATVRAVRPLIQRLRDRQLAPVRLDELINAPLSRRP